MKNLLTILTDKELEVACQAYFRQIINGGKSRGDVGYISDAVCKAVQAVLESRYK